MPEKPSPPPRPPPPRSEYNGNLDDINAADLLSALAAFLIVGLATYLYLTW